MLEQKQNGEASRAEAAGAADAMQVGGQIMWQAPMQHQCHSPKVDAA